MRTATARLEKIEARMPAPTPTVEPVDATSGLQAAIEKVLAESARVEALPLAGKIRHMRAKIDRQTEEARQPAPPDRPGGVTGLSASIHALKVAMAKNEFREERFEVRGYEIELLREHGYDIAQLEARHSSWKEQPGEWCYENEALPDDAERLLSEILAGDAG